MTVFEKIIQSFDEQGIKYESLEHEPVYTSADAAKIRDTKLSDGAKALVFLADKNPILVVLPGDKKVDTTSFKKLFGISDLAMATKEQVKEITGLEVGAIPPVGSVMGLKVYFDDEFKSKDIVSFNAGSHSKSIRIQASELIKVENPIFYGQKSNLDL